MSQEYSGLNTVKGKKKKKKKKKKKHSERQRLETLA